MSERGWKGGREGGREGIYLLVVGCAWQSRHSCPSPSSLASAVYGGRTRGRAGLVRLAARPPRRCHGHGNGRRGPEGGKGGMEGWREEKSDGGNSLSRKLCFCRAYHSLLLLPLPPSLPPYLNQDPFPSRQQTGGRLNGGKQAFWNPLPATHLFITKTFIYCFCI